MDQVDKVLTRGVEKILPNKEGLEKLMRKRKIRVYLGVDPTGINLHLGHTIPLRKLAEFADLGHEAILLIGTGTILAGDPSQRENTRPKITQKEIEKNMATWQDQAKKVIDLSKVQIRYNGDWLLKLNLADIINIASKISATQLFKREMFQKRLNQGDTVWYHETFYPLLQGYDSVVMDVDLEIGGTDQTFNMLIGRQLQKKMKNREKYVLSTPLILGIDGKPMSKTSNNCIWLTDTASEMFGKLMSINDPQIEPYWKLLTSLSEEDIKKYKPMDAKKMLAFEIVKIYHGATAAQKAKKEFEKVVQKGEIPKDLNIRIKENISLVEAVKTLVHSKSQAKRLLDQGAVEIDGKVEKDSKIKVKEGQVLKVGKRTFAKVEK